MGRGPECTRGAPITEGDFEDYWAVNESIDFADRSTHTSQGEGIYVLTKDESGFYNVSMSNPRIVTEDIVPMTYRCLRQSRERPGGADGLPGNWSGDGQLLAGGTASVSTM